MANVLVVDDAAFMRKLLTNILTKAGHNVVGEAETAKDAIDQYEKLKPDLVTLDIVMPELDDINTLKAIGTILESDPDARIIMVSSMGQDDWVMGCVGAGAKDFIVKPFKPPNVINTVNRVLKLTGFKA